MPRLALFDLDDTLISSKDAFVAWIGEVVAEHGVGGDAHSFLEKEHVFWTGTPDDTFRGLVEFFALPADPADLMHAYRGRMVELLTPYPGVQDGLEALRDAGWRIGIVTNGFGDFQNAKIDAVGLRAYVDVVCISDVEGTWKPEAKIFELASDRAGAPLEGGWMIGDSLAADIAGGNGAGLHTAWLHHGRPLPSAAAGDPQPEYIIERTAEAFDLILGRP
ncbi:pyrimidine 5'-nucleotidase [Catenulispora yoronensis]|uniref:Pyrimidine 5'-nucleotidase n=1 Tax=Catenulispora yoronensis TaxID=450799 RepID=A0ABP5GDP1_9ACTN